MTPRRKDESKRVLKEGEYQRDNGTYEFKWRDANGKRHSQYAKTLEELRDKEAEILRDIQFHLIITCQMEASPLTKSLRIRTQVCDNIINMTTDATNQLCLLLHQLEMHGANNSSF